MSRRPNAPGAARFRLRLERRGPALWWDQKQFLGALRGMLERAGLDRRRDGAFVSAAPVSPPGCRSSYEYAELALATPSTSAGLMQRLRNALARGLHLRSVVRLMPWAPGIRGAVDVRCFETVCPGADSARAARFLAADQWPWTRWKRGAPRTVDIRPAVRELICLSGRVRFALEWHDSAPKPAEVMATVFGLPVSEAVLLPTACTGIRSVPQPPVQRERYRA